ncbi:MAG: hypothetical protein HS126_18715 [Anaerolineales bacterium]|nr:hypothetical protein [Anaerolineales bacterium]
MHKKFLFLLIMLFVLGLFGWSAGRSRAAADPVAAQATIGSGTAASCQTNAAVNAFSNAVAAGGVVDFNCGPNPVVITVNTTIVNQQATVNGNGLITLSGEDLRQIFYVMAAGNLTLNDIELIDGSAGSGGAIYVEAPSTVTLNRTSISSSNASNHGGAIYNLGTLILNDSTLDSNVAGMDGGGIYNNGGSVTINNTNFYDNYANRGGAVANAQSSTVTLNGGSMSSNHSTGDGGAIHNRGTLTVNRTTLGSNIAGGNGGGIFNNAGVVALYDSYLVSNQSVNGGGVYTVNGQLTLERTAVRSSFISNQGGGIFAASKTQITNSTFSGNRALKGGGIFAIFDLAILNSTFNENRADTGGAIWRDQAAPTMTLKNSILAGSRDTNGSSPSLNCDGPSLTSLGRNIISDNSCVPNPSSVGDLLGTDPQLGVWLSPTPRGYIPAASSPAIDYGLDCPAIDQRGYPRPLGVACDVGSIERSTPVYLPVVIR